MDEYIMETFALVSQELKHQFWVWAVWGLGGLGFGVWAVWGLDFFWYYQLVMQLVKQPRRGRPLLSVEIEGF